MHRCLQTVDTLLLILQYFKAHDGLPITQNTSALSALARTCRAFCDLALDLLWENQWTLVNLVRCLPADAWRIDIEEHMEVGNDGAIPKPPEGSVSVIRPLFTSDWERFDFYAPRIKFLRLSLPQIEHDTIIVLQPVTLATLSAFHAPRPLLPCLQILHLYEPSSRFGNVANMLAGPPLRQLVVLWPEDLPHTLPLLAHVAHVAPHLTNLSIGRSSAVYQPDILFNLRDLQHVELVMPAEEAHASDMLAWLAQLPHLQSLGLQRVSFCLSELSMKSNIDPLLAFGKLQDLKLSPDTIPKATSSLALFSSSPIRGICISESPDVKASPLHSTEDFLAAVVKLCDPSRLEFFTFIFKEAQPDSGPLRLFDLKGLLVFRKMKHFSLVSPIPVALSDSDLKEVAMAWPSLFGLRLGNRLADAAVEPRPTLRTLAELAIHCPCLQELELTMHAAMGTFVPLHHPVGGRALHRLTFLDVGASPITHSTTVALLLSDLCPNLRNVSHTVHWPTEFTRCQWDEVSRFLTVLSLSRRQERFRFQAMVQMRAGTRPPPPPTLVLTL